MFEKMLKYILLNSFLLKKPKKVFPSASDPEHTVCLLHTKASFPFSQQAYLLIVLLGPG